MVRFSWKQNTFKYLASKTNNTTNENKQNPLILCAFRGENRIFGIKPSLVEISARVTRGALANEDVSFSRKLKFSEMRWS